MWIKSCFLAFVLISKTNCGQSEAAKVDEVSFQQAENSTISFIKYSNNGNFNVPTRAMNNLTKLITEETVEPVLGSEQDASSSPQQLLTSSQCGGTFRKLQNLIEIPKFISPRPLSNLKCEYQIVSPYICENDFHVQFLDFEIDSSPDCENDRVIINYSDVLCGKIIGVKKFRTNGGVLNITFTSRLWNLKQGKGFRLLVTRLPCVDKSKEDQTEVDSLEPTAPKIDEDEKRCFNVNSSYTVDEPIVGREVPIYGVPTFNRTIISGRQDIPVIPLPPFQPIDPNQPPYIPPYLPPYQPPYQPPYRPPYQPILPPQFLHQCCRNNYNLQRFIMLTQGFPSYLNEDKDCIFVINRSSPNVCRLRIIFKYFLLDDPQQGQFGCTNNFIEIDGQRMCGCKTNFVYETQWGLWPKLIRMRTLQGSYTNAQGFVFDVIQEPCPYKLFQNNVQVQSTRQKRHLISEKYLSHPFLIKGHLTSGYGERFGQQVPSLKQIKSDIDESFKSKFFQQEPNYNVCVMNHLRLFQLKLELLAIPKQYCIPF